MPGCLYPLYAYRDSDATFESGKPLLRFVPSKAGHKPEIPGVDILTIPCGQCVNCRLAHSREWAVRMMHEAKMHKHNSFITLTYDPKYLPPDGSLSVREFQLFMKRFRKQHPDLRIRFFHCGEYGDQHMRPHYHAIIFGYDFPDKKFWKRVFNPKGDDELAINYYISEELSKLWEYGFSTIGDVTFESCAYVARYVMKKITGKSERVFNRYFHPVPVDNFTNGITPNAYSKLSDVPSEFRDEYEDEIKEMFRANPGCYVCYRAPEYITMSRKPGIGYDFFERYWRDIYPNDICVDARGHRSRPPAYYDRLLEENFPAMYREVKSKRSLIADEIIDDDFKRLSQRAEYAHLISERLIRNLESEI